MLNQTITELLEQKKYGQLKEFLKTQNQVDLAEQLEQIENPTHLLKVFRLLQKDVSAEIFSYLNPEIQELIINEITEKELENILEELYLDDTIDMLEVMPANIVSRVLQATKKEKREQINKFLGYEEKTAGSLMTPEYLDLKENMTIEQAFKKIRKEGQEKETINFSYVLDNTRKLIGVVSIKDLFKADEDAKIKAIMNSNIIFVNTSTPEEEIALLFKKYDLTAIPVVDHEQRMVGIITVDDILDVIEEGATEDFEKMAALTPSEQSYLKTGVLRHARNRIVWLLLLMITAIFTGLLLTSYEEILAKEIILVAFLPLLMDTAGNCGSQTSTLMIRGMALGEIEFKQFFKIFWKESRISLSIGSVLALFNFVRIILQYNRIDLAFAISLTVIATVFIANMIGMLMPLLAKKLKLDPAVVSAPMITTILDCLVILIYFTISSSILGI